MGNAVAVDISPPSLPLSSIQIINNNRSNQTKSDSYLSCIYLWQLCDQGTAEIKVDPIRISRFKQFQSNHCYLALYIFSTTDSPPPPPLPTTEVTKGSKVSHTPTPKIASSPPTSPRVPQSTSIPTSTTTTQNSSNSTSPSSRFSLLNLLNSSDVLTPRGLANPCAQREPFISSRPSSTLQFDIYLWYGQKSDHIIRAHAMGIQSQLERDLKNKKNNLILHLFHSGEKVPITSIYNIDINAPSTSQDKGIVTNSVISSTGECQDSVFAKSNHLFRQLTKANTPRTNGNNSNTVSRNQVTNSTGTTSSNGNGTSQPVITPRAVTPQPSDPSSTPEVSRPSKKTKKTKKKKKKGRSASTSVESSDWEARKASLVPPLKLAIGESSKAATLTATNPTKESKPKKKTKSKKKTKTSKSKSKIKMKESNDDSSTSNDESSSGGRKRSPVGNKPAIPTLMLNLKQQPAKPSRPKIPSLDAGKTPDEKKSTGLSLLIKNLPEAPPEDNQNDKATEIEIKEKKLARFDTICSKITDSLFLGSQTVSRDKKSLDNNGITHILNCAGAICPVYYPDDYEYRTLFLFDDVREDMSLLIYDIIEWVDKVLTNKGKILIHCQQGVSRSSAMMIGYLMWKNKWEYEETQAFVKNLRGVSSPNAGFICQLLILGKRLRAKKVSSPRLHKIVPHSKHTPDFLVGKRSKKSDFELKSPETMNSKCFILHTEACIYIWVGSQVEVEKEKAAKETVRRVQMFEPSAPSEVIIVRQGEESSAFLSALETIT